MDSNTSKRNTRFLNTSAILQHSTLSAKPHQTLPGASKQIPVGHRDFPSRKHPQEQENGNQNTVANKKRLFSGDDHYNKSSKIGHGVKRESPWESYIQAYQLKFDRFITVAIRRKRIRRLVIVRTLPDTDGTLVQMLYEIRHDRFLAVVDAFLHEGLYHIVFERPAISLGQLVGCPSYPSEIELKAILGQVRRDGDEAEKPMLREIDCGRACISCLQTTRPWDS